MGLARVLQVSCSDQRRHHAWNLLYLPIRIYCPRQRGSFVSGSMNNSRRHLFWFMEKARPFVVVSLTTTVLILLSKIDTGHRHMD